MPKPRRRQPKKKAPRRTAPPQRERTKPGRPRAASPASRPTERVQLHGDQLRVSEALVPKIMRRRGRPPGGQKTKAAAVFEQLRLLPLGALEADGTPLGAGRRAKMLLKDGVSVSTRYVARLLADARRSRS